VNAVTSMLIASIGPQPIPDAPRGLDPNDVSPGVAGFIATFAVTAVTVLLILAMVRSVRRIRHRALVEAREHPELLTPALVSDEQAGDPSGDDPAAEALSDCSGDSGPEPGEPVPSAPGGSPSPQPASSAATPQRSPR